MENKSLYPFRLGEFSFVHFYLFSGTWYYQRKRAPNGVFFMLLESIKLKSPSSIYFLRLTKNPQDCTTTVSLDTTPHITVWQHSHFGLPLFRVLCNVPSLDPISIKSVLCLQVFPICSDIPDIIAIVPFPWVKFHLLPGPPCRHTLNKGSLSLPLPPAPIQFSPSLPSAP